ncbi:MAG TPA: phosphopantetheine-binding protein, partial [Thermoanaerobaculia bacterium]|nr:phosphopantetheine-binding protein [Thermoanaerobaculia bacterium]
LHTLLGGRIDEGQKTVAGIVAELSALPGSVLSLPAELRGYLRERLPAHLVPVTVEIVDSLPLNGNGKVDRGALAARRVRRGAPASGDQPRGELERAIARVWREVLGIEEIGVQDNFFELGGSSLHLVQVYRRLKEMAPGLSTRELFRQPTIHALARHLGAETSPSTGPTDLSASARRAEMRRNLRRQRSED